MELRPIRTEADYDGALAEYERFFDDEPEPGTTAADRFEVLGLLLRDYETRRWPLEPVDPVAVLRFAIDSLGRTQADLARVLGSRSRASELLGRRRPLTIEMIRKISDAWGIPVAALARAYGIERPTSPAPPRRAARRRDRVA